MKTSVQATPNQLLRREREWRGWSRQYVAEQIGSDFNMIGRWERGNIFPSPIRTNLRKDEAKRSSICDDIRKGIQISIPEGAVPW